MESFFRRTRIWDRNPRIHVYVVPDLGANAELAWLVHQAKHVLLGHESVTPVPNDWLHLTVASTDNVNADGEAVAAEMERQLHHRNLPTGTVTVTSPMATTSSVLSPCADDPHTGVFGLLQEAAAEAFAAAAGSVQGQDTPPHLSIGYGTGPGNSAAINSAMWRHVQPAIAALTVDQVVVANVVQDPRAGTYTWTEVARIGL